MILSAYPHDSYLVLPWLLVMYMCKYTLKKIWVGLNGRATFFVRSAVWWMLGWINTALMRKAHVDHGFGRYFPGGNLRETTWCYMILPARLGDLESFSKHVVWHEYSAELQNTLIYINTLRDYDVAGIGIPPWRLVCSPCGTPKCSEHFDWTCLRCGGIAFVRWYP